MSAATRKLTALFFSTAIFAVTSLSAQAAVLTVTNTQDSGAGSLRDTIAAATDGDTIQFDAALNGQTITLTSAQLLINKNLTINGPGADKLTVGRSTANGIPAFRIFQISGNVSLAGLTIANGNIDGGGGIVSFGYAQRLTITNCVISGNSAPGGSGGGIVVGGGSAVSITNSTISGNSATRGGGIYIVDNANLGILGRGTLTMINSTISGNVAASQGGGLYNAGSATITNSTISVNVATIDAAGGGGVFITGAL